MNNSTYFGSHYLHSEGLAIPSSQTSDEVSLLQQHIEQPGSKIIDLCCGHGRHCAELVRWGATNLTGIDYSESSIAYAMSSVSTCQFKAEDIFTADFESNNDLVYSLYNSMAYWDENELRSLFAKIKKSLSPRGRFIFDFVPTQTYKTYHKLYQHGIWSKLIYLVAFRKALIKRYWCRDVISIDISNDYVVFDRSYYHILRKIKQSRLKVTLFSEDKLVQWLMQSGFQHVEIQPKGYFNYVIAS